MSALQIPRSRMKNRPQSGRLPPREMSTVANRPKPLTGLRLPGYSISAERMSNGKCPANFPPSSYQTQHAHVTRPISSSSSGRLIVLQLKSWAGIGLIWQYNSHLHKRKIAVVRLTRGTAKVCRAAVVLTGLLNGGLPKTEAEVARNP
jgi:hypothetical protein